MKHNRSGFFAITRMKGVNMARRKLEELNLLDNFLFGSVLNYPVLGEKFARILLKIVLGKEFEKLKIIPQRIFYGNNTDRHGAQLDVYMETIDDINEEGRESVFDVEPDKNDKKKLVENLPRRTRFYHALIDTECLKSGENYKGLKNVVVIMITSYDPFGLGRMVYTIKNKCEEEIEMEYEDGAKTIYLYTKGKPENVSKEMVEFLHYVENTSKENACNEDLLEIHKIVQQVKLDKGVILEHMKSFERDELLREEVREEEQMKSFEREQQIREEVREEEQMKSFEREQKIREELLGRIQEMEKELARFRK